MGCAPDATRPRECHFNLLGPIQGTVSRNVSAVGQQELVSRMSWNNPITVNILAPGIFASVIGAMAVGVIFGRRQLSGSCGGIANQNSRDRSINCSLCSHTITFSRISFASREDARNSES